MPWTSCMAAWVVRRFFGEQPFVTQRTVDFVRGDVVEAAISFCICPSGVCSVEQRCGPEDVGFEESHGVFDASVHVAFSR